MKAVFALLLLGGFTIAAAAPDKGAQTPCFWQRDPDGEFENEGRNHCAPVAISDGLIYLSAARGFSDLVAETGHDGQMALVNDLAEKMATDAVEGTSPDKIVTGLLSYAETRGYSFDRLEVATWRSLRASNRKYKVAAKPALNWMIAAAKDPDTVEVLNFGWYKQEDDGTYTRHSGHWVNVIGAGPGAGQLQVHNPMLQPDKQVTDTVVTLKRLDDNFVLTMESGDELKLAGYYEAEGPGLPFNNNKYAAAVLDSVIVFKLKKD
jgi:hypothetical protein